ncbi:HAD family hydrolase [Thermodesulfobacteriota bacterium]
MITRPWEVQGLKACLFDFGGTLDADGVTWQDRFFELYRRHGLEVDRELFRNAFYHADDHLIETRALGGAGFEETITAQVAGVCEVLGLEDSCEPMRLIIRDFIESTQRLIRRNRPLLSELQGRFRLGIVSNFYGNLERVCDDLAIRDYFPCMIDSTCEGVMKPDPKIFQAALDRLDVKPGEAVYVGDNPFRDMEGARAIGMPHVRLIGADRRRPETCCPGDPVIHSLEELVPLLTEGKGGDGPDGGTS